MTITYNSQVAASYNQQLQAYQSKLNNGTITQSELNQAKEIALQYYEYLHQSGIEYGDVANEVMQSSSFFGAYANGMLKDAIQEKNPSASQSQINFDIDKIAVSLAVDEKFLRNKNLKLTQNSKTIFN